MKINIKENLDHNHKKVSLFLIKNKILSTLLLLSFFLNCFLFYSITEERSKNEESASLFPLLSKRIFSEDQNDIIINFYPLKQKMKKYLDSKNGEIGIYFEYLPSGSSIGIHDTDDVRLVSLAKVPLAMSILKKIEKGELKMRDTIVLKKEFIDESFGNLWKRGEGIEISIQEVLEICLKDSDNTAYKMLFSLVNETELLDVYNELNIELVSVDSKPMVSPKSYSSIFRNLFLSSYLKKENSQYLLDVLTKTSFNDKLPAGVPEDVLVSHKIGVFEDADTSKQVFIDCGIVYIPKRPYIVCSFVKNSNEEASRNIQYLSKIIYEYVLTVKR